MTALLCAGVLAVAPTAASAAVTCTVAGDAVTVAPDNSSAVVTIERIGATEIGVYNGTAVPANKILCVGGTPDINTTSTIDVVDIAAHDVDVHISLLGGVFEPGAAPPEATGVSEIEFDVDGGNGDDALYVDGSDGADVFRFGQTAPGALRANLNVDRETTGQDYDDIATTSVHYLFVNGRKGADDINAAGDAQAMPVIDSADPEILTLQGGNDADFLRGGVGADILQGGSQDDNLVGGAGDDALDGGTQNDKLDGGGDADGIEGGEGTDRVLYDDRSTPQVVSIGDGVANDGGSEDNAPAGRDNVGLTVENATGGASSDFLAGSALQNSLIGGDGVDTINGLAGNDKTDGGFGADRIDGGAGNDTVRGQGEADLLLGSSGSDRMFGGDADDRLFGAPGGDFLRGDKGRDLMKGQDGNDRIAAKDGKKDRKIDCGAGKASKESAKGDKRDPKPRSC